MPDLRFEMLLIVRHISGMRRIEEGMWGYSRLHFFLTLDIEDDGFSPLFIYDDVCEDAGDKEKPDEDTDRQGRFIKSSRAFDIIRAKTRECFS